MHSKKLSYIVLIFLSSLYFIFWLAFWIYSLQKYPDMGLGGLAYIMAGYINLIVVIPLCWLLYFVIAKVFKLYPLQKPVVLSLSAFLNFVGACAPFFILIASSVSFLINNAMFRPDLDVKTAYVPETYEFSYDLIIDNKTPKTFKNVRFVIDRGYEDIHGYEGFTNVFTFSESTCLVKDDCFKHEYTMDIQPGVNKISDKGKLIFTPQSPQIPDNELKFKVSFIGNLDKDFILDTDIDNLDEIYHKQKSENFKLYEELFNKRIQHY